MRNYYVKNINNLDLRNLKVKYKFCMEVLHKFVLLLRKRFYP